MSAQGTKFLFYQTNALLQRQLKHSHWQFGWCAHHGLAGVEGLLWVSSIAMNCFMVSMSMESLVDLALATEVTVGTGMCR